MNSPCCFDWHVSGMIEQSWIESFTCDLNFFPFSLAGENFGVVHDRHVSDLSMKFRDVNRGVNVM